MPSPASRARSHWVAVQDTAWSMLAPATISRVLDRFDRGQAVLLDAKNGSVQFAQHGELVEAAGRGREDTVDGAPNDQRKQNPTRGLQNDKRDREGEATCETFQEFVHCVVGKWAAGCGYRPGTLPEPSA